MEISGSASTSVNRARDVAQLLPRARRIRHEAAVWAVQHGCSLDFDALTIILAAKQASDGEITCWTDDDVWHLWWVDLMTWCRMRQVPVPAQLACTFATFFRYLDDVDGFEPGSHPLAHLVGALDAAGAQPRHPSSHPVGS